jgi:hypothetical protein
MKPQTPAWAVKNLKSHLFALRGMVAETTSAN